MDQDQRNSNNTGEAGNEQQDNMNNESLNTASGLRAQAERQSDSAGSGRSYDYGAEGSTEEDLNQQLGRNSNQQNVSGNSGNDQSSESDDSGSISGAGRTDSRMGSGSGLSPLSGTTGSDLDGQTR